MRAGPLQRSAAVAVGIDGVECFYAAHNDEQTRALYDVARERGLLSTGSAGFHGPGTSASTPSARSSCTGLEPNLGRIGP
jgi:3',5'-nucleoside bisphosphate phosphatase